ncbi:transglycosylase SLT domain-containing protein [Streptomyces johnsoniae]|uniref:Transglycosylase SLT domain-containing protein n=1 Tax=Streptomyces johnsoniae TaxID=3075532 RepID=A0ABU2S9U8_9ACTN|nr:transglycosylase SLT domain-containing protein [Streptomyces sp. DSM 41886]MDT0445219.1 transglycosylase SLT domain-containing protein [Streptomyces sp. DSM 41886]
MTASTNDTRTTVTRTVALAGIVTAGAAALTLPFAPTAAADDAAAHGVSEAAERTAAPAAFAPNDSDGVIGKAPGAENDERTENTENDERTENTENTGRADDDASRDESGDASRDDRGDDGAGEVADRGRGAEYREDGTLVTIPRHEQPEPQPASDEDIDRWIDEALEVLDEKGIPGSYEGIHRNLMRESSGDPQTINLWDTNAQENIPSKGLLQVIDPTFEQYHVEGTSKNIYDPVANIAAACNYAAERYGSMDNVDSAY